MSTYENVGAKIAKILAAKQFAAQVAKHTKTDVRYRLNKFNRDNR